ncbi:MAG: ATP-dependent helicase HrpB [Pseudomonadota bacterium]
MELPSLPVDHVLPDLCAALARGPNAVLAAPPGAGKTSRVPLALLDTPWRGDGRILMLEPRRVAARAAAERLAAQRGETVGGTIGYRIRGARKVSDQTRIEVVTEGILTRMIQKEPDLPGIAAILFDEVHERSIHSDLGLALALEVQEALRPDLRLVTMSATLDTAAFAQLMRDAPVIESAGRTHPVETRWQDRTWRTPGKGRRGFEEAAASLIRTAAHEAEGDILAFLPGAGEIRRVAAALEGRTEMAIDPLYGALPFQQQRAVLVPRADGRRRVILATAIAETSLTVPGVRVVVDGGLARRSRTDHATGMARLVTVPVSRAEADQRRGRAGREAPGICYRMWTRGEDGALPTFAPPEILETDLAPLALELAQWGATTPDGLRFLDPPPDKAFRAAQDLLRDLGALDRDNRITPHGHALAAQPLHPRLAHMIARAADDGLEGEAALLAAILNERDPLAGTHRHTADLALRVAAIAGNRGGPAADPAIRKRTLEEARRLSRAKPDTVRLATALGPLTALAYPDRIALRRPGDAPRYLLSNGRGAVMDAADPLASQRLLIATDLEDGREARIRLAAPISEADLRAAHGDLIRTVHQAEWSPRTRSVEARMQERLGAIALIDQAWRDVPPDQLGAALAVGVRNLGLAALPWSDAATALRRRIAWLAERSPDLALPDLSDAALIAALDTWLTPHLTGMRRIDEIDRLDLTSILRNALDWQQQQTLDRLAPPEFKTPSGRAARIDYTADIPKISVRVQDLYGLTTHPALGQPPVPLAIELLSPANRPVQITADLPGFWRTSYADVRKDMRARYPKHDWPEDPATAAPRGANPRQRRTSTEK